MCNPIFGFKLIYVWLLVYNLSSLIFKSELLILKQKAPDSLEYKHKFPQFTSWFFLVLQISEYSKKYIADRAVHKVCSFIINSQNLVGSYLNLFLTGLVFIPILLNPTHNIWLNFVKGKECYFAFINKSITGINYCIIGR